MKNKTSLDTWVCHQLCTGNAVLPTRALFPHSWTGVGLACVQSFSATNRLVHRSFPTRSLTSTIKIKKKK